MLRAGQEQRVPPPAAPDPPTHRRQRRSSPPPLPRLAAAAACCCRKRRMSAAAEGPREAAERWTAEGRAPRSQPGAGRRRRGVCEHVRDFTCDLSIRADRPERPRSWPPPPPSGGTSAQWAGWAGSGWPASA